MESNKILLKEWFFFKGDVKSGEIKALNAISNWKLVEIPHTWNNIDALNGGAKRFALSKEKRAGYYRGCGLYKTTFTLPDKYRDKRIFIRFEAVGTVADVFLNGQHIGHHKGGFSAFCIQLPSNLIQYDEENLIVVRASNAPRKDLPPLSGDFPVMGGIYRPVYLMVKNQICISPIDYASSGIYITQNSVTKEKAEISVKVVVLSNNKRDNISIDIEVLENSKAILEEIHRVELKEKAQNSFNCDLTISNPHLWDGLRDPYLYTLRVTVYAKGEFADQVDQFIGFRFIEIHPKKGFFLNGSSYPVYGVCRHQDRVEKGWAITKEEQEEDLQLIKEMGARGVRLAHYQHSDYFYHLCDTRGLLVWAEIALVNKVSFSQAFLDNTSNMLIELIRQNYNHPSIFTWGLCNELGIFQFRNPAPVVRKLNYLAKKEDPIRPTTLAIIPQAKFRGKLHHISDIVGINVYPGWYYKKPDDIKDMIEEWNDVRKGQGIAISEYGAGASILHHEENPRIKGTFRSAGSDWHPEEKQNIIHETTFKHIYHTPNIWGSFVWNMFDFAVPARNEGDTVGRNDKGLVTYDRQVKKDAYYFYKVNLNPEPMIYITSRRFVNRTSSRINVKAYSNGSIVHLSLNGNYMGKMEYEGMNVHRSTLNLTPGKNSIYVKTEINGEEISDQCEWILKPT